MHDYPHGDIHAAIVQREAAQPKDPLVTINPLMINAITATAMKMKLMHVEMRVNSHQVHAMIHTKASNVFIVEHMATRLSLCISLV